MFGISREAIRVKVKKCESSLPTEYRKFSVDPQITSFEVLQSILAKAFDLKGDFAICYRLIDDSGSEKYLPLLSDWDLDEAFLKAYNISLVSKIEPCLYLRVELKPLHECPEECEVKQFNYSLAKPLRTLQEVKSPARLHGIFNQVGKTINLMQKAFNFGEDGSNTITLQFPPKAPLSDAEFRRYLDPVGQIINAKELRSCIYFGGIEPSLRKVVWKHLLNVYPNGMSGRERMDYIKKKASEYCTLKEVWKSAIAQGVDGELAYTTGMVKKDVLRTDRHLGYYAGNDENKNIASLFNILTTYALNHPKVSYCQGMSDLASPLLVTMNDEAHAYICFCALMERLSTNFMLDGIAMTQKFTHLSEALMYYDPEFYNYLKIHQADDLLFCYRWLLLEMKREFAFEDSLRMLEVLWSSLPADHPQIELKLFDVKFQPTALSTPPISPLVKTPFENAYTKLCALRRRSSSISLNNNANKKKLDKSKRLNHSLDEIVIKSKIINESKMKQQSFDDAAVVHNNKNDGSPKSLLKTPKSPQSIHEKSSPNHLQNFDCREKSVSPLEEKSDSAVYVNNKMNNSKVEQKTKSLSSSMTNLIRNNKGKHFRELKEKIVSSKIFSSLEQLDSSLAEMENKRLGKMIKDLNEFNFVSLSKNKVSDRIINHDGDNPKITLTKSNADDSETSSIGHNSSNFSKSRHVSTTSCSGDDTFDDYSPDDQEYIPVTATVSNELKLKMEKLDQVVFGEQIEGGKVAESSADIDEVDHVSNNYSEQSGRAERKRGDDVFVWENPLHLSSPNTQKSLPCMNNDTQIEKPLGNAEHSEMNVSRNLNIDHVKCNGTDNMTNSCEEVTENIIKSSALPPPNEFGGGNPFLMFLCITVLLQHRDHIISKGLDYNETAMHFDKMIRKHDVVSVLNQARQMYASYMKQQSLLLRHHKT